MACAADANKQTAISPLLNPIPKPKPGLLYAELPGATCKAVYYGGLNNYLYYFVVPYNNYSRMYPKTLF